MCREALFYVSQGEYAVFKITNNSNIYLYGDDGIKYKVIGTFTDRLRPCSCIIITISIQQNIKYYIFMHADVCTMNIFDTEHGIINILDKIIQLPRNFTLGNDIINIYFETGTIGETLNNNLKHFEYEQYLKKQLSQYYNIDNTCFHEHICTSNMDEFRGCFLPFGGEMQWNLEGDIGDGRTNFTNYKIISNIQELIQTERIGINVDDEMQEYGLYNEYKSHIINYIVSKIGGQYKTNVEDIISK